MNGKKLIETKNMSRSFDGTRAVDRLSIEVFSGEVFGLLGHNGAGKTTTIRLLTGLLKASAGSVSVLGHDPAVDGPSLRAKTGVLTETPSLDERLTGRENLSIYADLFGVDPDQVQNRVEELLERFELTGRGDDPVGEYSKGMKQRLALARTLLHDPLLLFLDEPTAGLDPVSARGVHDLIQQSAGKGKTVLLCTHNLEEAQKLCHRVAVLNRGEMIALGSPRELGKKISTQSRVQVEVGTVNGDQALEYFKDQNISSKLDPEQGMIELQGIDREEIPALIQGAVTRGIDLYQVIVSQPTLEDIYFALHQNRERES